MKQILLAFVFAVSLVFSADSVTYFRKNTYSEKGFVVANYVSVKDTTDTLQTQAVPGTRLPFKIVVKDDVVVDNNLGIKFFAKKDSLNETSEPSNEND